MPELVEFFANLAQRKLRFLSIILTLGAAGIVYAHGWSWMTAMVVLVVLFALGGFWILTSFWIGVFRNFGRREQR